MPHRSDNYDMLLIPLCGCSSDVWSAGCILYELVAQRHAFEASSLTSLVRKIIAGKVRQVPCEKHFAATLLTIMTRPFPPQFPPLPEGTSLEVRLLVDEMLQLKPRRRPPVEQILAMPFLQPYTAAYVRRCEAAGERVPCLDIVAAMGIAAGYGAIPAEIRAPSSTPVVRPERQRMRDSSEMRAPPRAGRTPSPAPVLRRASELAVVASAQPSRGIVAGAEHVRLLQPHGVAAPLISAGIQRPSSAIAAGGAVPLALGRLSRQPEYLAAGAVAAAAPFAHKPSAPTSAARDLGEGARYVYAQAPPSRRSRDAAADVRSIAVPSYSKLYQQQQQALAQPADNNDEGVRSRAEHYARAPSPVAPLVPVQTSGVFYERFARAAVATPTIVEAERPRLGFGSALVSAPQALPPHLRVAAAVAGIAARALPEKQLPIIPCLPTQCAVSAARSGDGAGAAPMRTPQSVVAIGPTVIPVRVTPFALFPGPILAKPLESQQCPVKHSPNRASRQGASPALQAHNVVREPLAAGLMDGQRPEQVHDSGARPPRPIGSSANNAAICLPTSAQPITGHIIGSSLSSGRPRSTPRDILQVADKYLVPPSAPQAFNPSVPEVVTALPRRTTNRAQSPSSRSSSVDVAISQACLERHGAARELKTASVERGESVSTRDRAHHTDDTRACLQHNDNDNLSQYGAELPPPRAASAVARRIILPSEMLAGVRVDVAVRGCGTPTAPSPAVAVYSRQRIVSASREPVERRRTVSRDMSDDDNAGDDKEDAMLLLDADRLLPHAGASCGSMSTEEAEGGGARDIAAPLSAGSSSASSTMSIVTSHQVPLTKNVAGAVSSSPAEAGPLRCAASRAHVYVNRQLARTQAHPALYTLHTSSIPLC